MNRWISALSLLLLVQVALLTNNYWNARSAEGTERKALVDFDSSVIDEILVGDELDNEALLVKSGERWLLEGLGKLPADPAKVDALLAAITGKSHGWPVAKSSTARQRFQVADYYYRRRLTFLSAGSPLATIFLGTSPGFRKVHARNEAQDNIYSITFSAFDTPAISGDWLEPRLLQVRAPLRIDADSYSLFFENGVWRSGIGGTPDEREREALINTLRTLRVFGVAKGDLQRELSAAEADLTLAVHSPTGEVTLELFALNEKHYIHSSEYPQFFKLSAYDFDRLAGIDFRLISGDAVQPETP